MTLLRDKIMVVDLRPQLDLFDIDRRLPLPRFFRLLLLLVPVLAVIHHLADRRVRHRGHLDQVEVQSISVVQRIRNSHDPDLLAVRPDQPDRICADLLVDANDVGYVALHLPRCYRLETFLTNAKSGASTAPQYTRAACGRAAFSMD